MTTEATRRVEWDYAPFGDRFFADMTDGIIGIAMALPAYFIVDRALLGIGNDFFGETGFGFTDVVMWFWFFFNMTYLVGKRGQSWGREIWGLKVVSYSGESIGFFRALFRNLFAIYISATVLYLGFLWVLWDGRRQAWHDKIFRTFVLRLVER